MTTTCVIQARMGSSRLPGKVLMDVMGRPMLKLMLARLQPLAVERLVVATTEFARDDPIEALCRSLGVPVFRGSEQDVLGRMAGALGAYPGEDVVRLTADCPLADPSVVEAVMRAHRTSGADYTSNTLLRTYPDGLDVEVVRSSVLRSAAARALDPIEREHVTPWIYRHPEWHTLQAHRGALEAGSERWTVDTASDLDRIRRMVALVNDPNTAPWTEFLQGGGPGNASAPGELRLRPASSADLDRLLAWRNDPTGVCFSGSGTSVAPEEHLAWIAANLDHPGTRIWVGWVGNRAVGQVRIDVANAVGVVSLVVDPTERGRGYGSAMVAGMVRAVQLDFQVVSLDAVVHRENRASQHVFDKSGFALASDGEFQVLRWWR